MNKNAVANNVQNAGIEYTQEKQKQQRKTKVHNMCIKDKLKRSKMQKQLKTDVSKQCRNAGKVVLQKTQGNTGLINKCSKAETAKR